MRLQHNRRNALICFSLLLCTSLLPGNNWYCFSNWFACHKKLSFSIALTTVVLIGLAYMQLKSLAPQDQRRSNDPGENPTASTSQTALERIGEALLLTVAGAAIHNKLSSNQFNSYMGSRVKEVVLTYDPERLASLHETYLGNFSEEEQDLLEDFRKSNFEKGQGVLLYGPPGTGKSLFVKEFARRSKSVLLMVPSSRINTGYAGDGAEIVARAFAQARTLVAQNKHVVLFFEEIDGIGNRERQTNSAADQSQVSTINQLLFERERMPKEVITFGATNKIENLDRAAKRFGRFDKKIKKGVPTKKERYDFLFGQFDQQPHLKSLFNIQDLAESTDTLSYADLNALCTRLNKAYAKQGVAASRSTEPILEKLKQEKEQSELKSKQEEREEREKELFNMQKDAHEGKWTSRMYNGIYGLVGATISVVLKKYFGEDA